MGFLRRSSRITRRTLGVGPKNSILLQGDHFQHGVRQRFQGGVSVSGFTLALTEAPIPKFSEEPNLAWCRPALKKLGGWPVE